MQHSPSSHRPGVLGAIGRTCYRHRRLTLAAWIVGTACLVTLWMQFGAPANNNLAGDDTGQSILNQHFPRQSGDTLTLAIKSTGPSRRPASRPGSPGHSGLSAMPRT